LHRDVKPDNVLFDARGEPRLSDFGLTKALDGASLLTRSGFLVGTPVYLAPEQARGEVTADVRTDVWGLGALLYEALSGAPPFAAPSLVELLEAIERAPLAAPRAPGGAPTGAAGELALRALSRAIDDRPATALELATACAAAAAPLRGPPPR